MLGQLSSSFGCYRGENRDRKQKLKKTLMAVNPNPVSRV